MTTYKARGNEIIDDTGKQIAIVMPTNGTLKAAKMMAAFAAQQMNHEERKKERAADSLPTLQEQHRDCR